MTLSEIRTWAQLQRQAVSVVARQKVPAKKGLQSTEGQARLLHDIANVELQAVELGIRTLQEFPDSPADFRNELEMLTREELGHFELCRSGLERLGFCWGQWPVHAMLIEAVAPEDTLLERVFIVHCYLEGSGLDSGEILLRRLSGVKSPDVQRIINKIVTDEIRHVSFGVRWFRKFAADLGLDPSRAMTSMIEDLQRRDRLPARGAEMAIDLRQQAGFLQQELKIISAVQKQFE